MSAFTGSARRSPRGRSLLSIIVSTVLVATGLAIGPAAIGASVANAAGPATLTVTIAPTTTPILAGATAQWTINYECSYVGTGVTTCDNALIKVDVTKLSPLGNAIVCATSGSTGNGDFVPTATGFEGTGANKSIAVGASGQLTFGCKTEAGITPDQSELTATATFTSDTATGPSSDTAAPIVVTSEPAISVDKTLLGLSVLDGVTVYQITADYIKTVPGEGDWNTKDPVLVDTLPAGAVFVSADKGGVYDAGTNTVTWPSSAGSNNATGPDFDVRLRVTYPSTTFGIADTVVNNVELTATTVTDEGDVSATDAVSHTFSNNTGGQGGVDKSVSPNATAATAIFKTEQYNWSLKVTNTGSVPIGGTVYDYPPCPSAPLNNSLPQDCDDPGFQASQFLNVPQGSEFTFYLADGTTQTVTKTTGRTVAYDVPAGWLIAGYSIKLAPGSVDPQSTLSINVVGKLTEGSAYAPTTQTNCAYYSITNAAPTTLVSIGDADKTCEVAYFKNAVADLRIAKTYTGGATAKVAGDTAPWSLFVSNRGAANDPAYLDAHVSVTDVLPAGVTYVPGSAKVTSAAGAFTYDTDFTTAGMTVTQSGQNLTFSFPADALLDRRHGFTITFDTMVNPGVGAATHTNEANVINNDDPTWTPTIGNGAKSRASFATGISAQAGSQKKVMGEYDAGFLGSTAAAPAVGTSPSGGTAQWQLNIGSLGSTPIDDLVIYDIFPYVGDTGVSGGQAGTPRGSEYQPSLTGPITLPSGVTATYSLSTNPCRPEVYPSQPAGCDATWLAAGAVTDWSLVRAVRIDASAKTYAPGVLEQVTYTMTLPAGAGPDQIAWNSLAYAATGPSGPLLPAEPVKVGIRAVYPSVDIEKVDGAGNDADDSDTPVAADPVATTPITFTITNNGGERLTDIAVTDSVTAGDATVDGLTCDFSALGGPASGTTWAGPFEIGDSFECSATVSALGFDATHRDLATVTGTGEASGTPVDDEDPYNAETPEKPVPAVDIEKVDAAGNDADDAASAVEVDPNGTTDLVFTITNTGPEALRDIVVTDAVTSGAGTVDGLSCVFPDGSSGTTWAGPFAIDASFECSATLSALGFSATHTDNATVAGVGVVSGSPVDDEDPYNAETPPPPVPSVDIVKTDAAGNDANTADEAVQAVHNATTDLVFTITNNGSEALRDIVVTDAVTAGAGTVDNLSCVFPDGSSGTTWAGPFAIDASFECSATLSALGFSATHTDNATVAGVGVVSGSPVDDEDPYNAETPPPPPTGIDIEKFNAAGADADTAEEAVPTAAADTTDLVFTITNTGDQRLKNINVSDAVTAGAGTVDNLSCVFPDGSTGTTWAGMFEIDASFECTATLSALGYGQTHTDNATVTADPEYVGEPVDDEDPYNSVTPPKPVPAIDIEKFDAAGNDADTTTDAVTVDATSTTALQFTITNTGPEALKDVAVTDVVTLGGAVVTDLSCTFPDGSAGVTWAGPFAVDAAFPCTATLSALGYNAAHTDNATVNAVGVISGDPVDDEDPYNSVTPPPPPPSVDIEKTDAAGNDADTAADAVTAVHNATTELKFTVTNDGDQRLKNINVSDAVTAGAGTVDNLSCVFPDGSTGTTWAGMFEIDASFECTATLSALGYGQTHTDNATVTADPEWGGAPVDDEDPYNSVTPPPPSTGIDIEKFNAAGADADTIGDAVKTAADATTALKFSITNTGDQRLKNIVVTDEVTAGAGTVDNLSCVFPDGSTGTTWAGMFEIDASFECTATLSALGYGQTHTDNATVTADPEFGGTPVDDEDPYFSVTPEAPEVDDNNNPGGNNPGGNNPGNGGGSIDTGNPGDGNGPHTLTVGIGIAMLTAALLLGVLLLVRRRRDSEDAVTAAVE